jgi:hypothetical protein
LADDLVATVTENGSKNNHDLNVAHFCIVGIFQSKNPVLATSPGETPTMRVYNGKRWICAILTALTFASAVSKSSSFDCRSRTFCSTFFSL